MTRDLLVILWTAIRSDGPAPLDILLSHSLYVLLLLLCWANVFRKEKSEKDPRLQQGRRDNVIVVSSLVGILGTIHICLTTCITNAYEYLYTHCFI